ncbi:MAG: phosphoenolpyruvate carboxylase [Planctomycetota bacterium]
MSAHPPPAPDAPTQPKPTDFLLRRDVRMLGYELGKVLQQHASEGLYDIVEEVRALAKKRREGDASASDELTNRIGSLDDDQLGELIRALACFFDLANLAEDRHRVRVLRARERASAPKALGQSLGAAIQQLADRGLSAQQVLDHLLQLEVDLVFTAHPTEAKRRTVRNTLGRLRKDLVELNLHDTLPRERERVLRKIKADLDCLWETETLRPSKPTVLEEVDRSLFVADSLWHVVPWLMRGLRSAAEQAYPDEAELFKSVHGVVRFGTWIGGDRDGNPFVTPEVTRDTLVKLRESIIEKHMAQCLALEQTLSISEKHHPISPALERMIEDAQRWPETTQAMDAAHPRERYRQALRIIHARLAVSATCDPVHGGAEAGYANADALLADLRTIAQSLHNNGHEALADGAIRAWIDRTEVFGLHLARLDIREDSRQLHQAIGEVLDHLAPGTAYADLDEAEKQALLTAPIDAAAAQALDIESLTEPTRNTVNLFVLLQHTAKHYGQAALGELIVSMTHAPSDVLAMLYLGRLAAGILGLDRPAAVLPAVPLFETIDDLRDAHETLDQLLNCAPYREHVDATGGTQTCMVGYSDSCKDGGFLASNWRLYDAQSKLATTSKKHGVGLVLFHGRGGSLGRGGGPAARGVLSLPPESVNHRIRITEQGEVLAERYDDPEIAFRHVEQVCWATLLVSTDKSERVSSDWSDALDRATQASIKKYRALRDDEAFLAYFDRATPINTIETLPIGSRPSRRRGARELANLRAIPYTFAWTQNRHLLTAWYGLGTGLSTIEPDVQRAMYVGWPMFRGMIHNAELALAKCDMAIGRHYAEFAATGEGGEGGMRLYQTVRDEFETTRDAVLALTGHDELLDGIPWLKRSIRVRNPYIDPLNLIQVELMRRGKDPHGDLLRLSVQAIAAGLRTTG